MMHNENNALQVSLIVGVNEEERPELLYRFLESVKGLDDEILHETIVVAQKDAQREALFQEKYPWVRLIQEGGMIPGGYFRNIGVQHASGKFLAFFEDHVIIHANYLKNLMAALDRGYDIVGGSVANGNPESISSWVQYFCEYHKWLPCLKGGLRDDLPGSNFVCRKQVLQKLGSFSEERFKLESHFFAKAKKHGFTLYFAPDIRTSHFNERRALFFSRKRFQYGRLYAARREFPLPKRLLYTCLSPLIAVLEYLRILNHAMCGKTYLKKFFLCTPQLLFTLFIWMGGECMGYLFGADAE
ncbi:MAG: glycosyltransferase [Candidatus Aminicenantes bacterium]|jgi:GT2 family glycosyltransferase